MSFQMNLVEQIGISGRRWQGEGWGEVRGRDSVLRKQAFADWHWVWPGLAMTAVHSGHLHGFKRGGIRDETALWVQRDGHTLSVNIRSLDFIYGMWEVGDFESIILVWFILNVLLRKKNIVLSSMQRLALKTETQAGERTHGGGCWKYEKYKGRTSEFEERSESQMIDTLRLQCMNSAALPKRTRLSQIFFSGWKADC